MGGVWQGDALCPSIKYIEEFPDFMISSRVLKMDGLFLLLVICVSVTSSLGQRTSWKRYCDGRIGSYPHPDYCNQYIVCATTTIYVMNCPFTLHFNAARGYCDYPGRANCQVSRPHTCPDVLVCPNHVKYFEFPDWSQCSSYYVCTSGLLEKKSCPEGLKYDFVNWKCTYPENATCFESKR